MIDHRSSSTIDQIITILGTDNPKRLDDRVVVITGGNSGIGEETSYDLARFLSTS